MGRHQRPLPVPLGYVPRALGGVEFEPLDELGFATARGRAPRRLQDVDTIRRR